jgi:hypothetical protein
VFRIILTTALCIILLVFVIETHNVFCEARTEFSDMLQIVTADLQKVNDVASNTHFL